MPDNASLRLYMAPMKGFTDWVYRNTFAEHFHGFDLAVSPFIASKRDCPVRRRHVRDVWPENNAGLPVVPQILSKVAADFTALADYLYDMGYETVNWNLGCPSPMVASKKRGSGLLPYTERIDAFLEDALSVMKGHLSIKIRLGWSSSAELLRLLPVLNRYPLKEVIIHPRTGMQAFGGTVDLDAFRQCLTLIDHPVVYNGDIRTLDDFQDLSGRFRDVDTWMIGRGFLADPFLPDAIRAGRDGSTEKIQRLKRFHGGLFGAYAAVLKGPSHLLKKMKGLWRYLALSFEPFPQTMKKIKKATRPEQYLDRVNRFFENEARLAGDGSAGVETMSRNSLGQG
ncbi:MAG: tRNA-dihydrouridine synthase family protein [Deltaproteobacteria bacterium]|nr:tRNA-dihydrouridine synthase family protein [Deltaproteobacteria bacterium]